SRLVPGSLGKGSSRWTSDKARRRAAQGIGSRVAVVPGRVSWNIRCSRRTLIGGPEIARGTAGVERDTAVAGGHALIREGPALGPALMKDELGVRASHGKVLVLGVLVVEQNQGERIGRSQCLRSGLQAYRVTRRRRPQCACRCRESQSLGGDKCIGVVHDGQV